MKDYKILFGYAAVLLSIGFVIRSITFAYAYPTGPSVSMGSIPYASFSGKNNTSILTTNSNENFIITGVVTSSSSCYLYVEDTVAIKNAFLWKETASQLNNSLNIVVSPNSTVRMAGGTNNTSSCSDSWYVQGYYAHP